jgi:hypothetical protein
MKWMEHAAHMGEMINAYKMLVGTPEERILLQRLRHRWEESIKMNFKEMWFWKDSSF